LYLSKTPKPGRGVNPKTLEGEKKREKTNSHTEIRPKRGGDRVIGRHGGTQEKIWKRA